MSWSLSLYDEALPIDELETAARAKFDEVANNFNPPLGDDAREQLEAAITAVRSIAESGAVGPGPYKASLGGHANPGHVPTSGWANDAVNVQLNDGRTLEEPAS